MSDSQATEHSSVPSEEKSSVTSEAKATSFEDESLQKDPGLVAEFLDFLLHNKKWWLIPILVVTLLLTALTFLAASPVAPFIYTLF